MEALTQFKNFLLLPFAYLLDRKRDKQIEVIEWELVQEQTRIDRLQREGRRRERDIENYRNQVQWMERIFRNNQATRMAGEIGEEYLNRMFSLTPRQRHNVIIRLRELINRERNEVHITLNYNFQPWNQERNTEIEEEFFQRNPCTTD